MLSALDTLIPTFWDKLIVGLATIASAFAIQVSIRGLKLFKKWRGTNSLAHQIKCATRIQEMLVELRIAADADRSYVFQFSNGTYYKNDVSQLNTVCTHESVRTGVNPIGPYKNDVLVSQLPHFFMDIMGKKCTAILTDKCEDVTMKVHLINQGVGIMMVAPFHNKRGDMEGFIGLDFLVDHKCVKGFTGVESPKCKATCHDIIDWAERIGFELRT